jgi:predicted secreted Zn-dependent protease
MVAGMPVRRIVPLALVLAVALAVPAGAAAPAPRIPHATMRYYDVGGVTPAQVAARMRLRAPVSPDDGVRWDAYTHWEYHWNWPGYGTSTCSLARATVTLSVVVSFPRWTHPAGAAPGLAAAWERFSRALARHEKGHVDYAVSHYPAVVRAIKRGTCRGANAAALAQLNLIRKHDVAYDAATRHGATQGATFPA